MCSFIILYILLGPALLITSINENNELGIFFGGLVSISPILLWLFSEVKSDNPTKSTPTTIVTPPSPPTPPKPPIPPTPPIPPSKVEDDITRDDIINNDIEFTDAGIYYKRKKWNGSRYTYSKQRVYAYKRSYHLDELGKPRFHICRCATIDAYIRSNSLEVQYRKSTYKEVKVKNMDRYDIETSVSNLPLCQNCYKKMNGQYSWIKSNMDNRDFVEVIDRLNWG